eukprot:TRINITY_DN16066_c0_g1_i1.p2 TRINITY_DN16066_c0_g1~~TRINITY_DN16066_c0_g1_i1.p2  ORF type:complete len:101 (+),score=5.46 TRINITY_DN16066_c0_g1_i1:292-594(+)
MNSIGAVIARKESADAGTGSEMAANAVSFAAKLAMEELILSTGVSLHMRPKANAPCEGIEPARNNVACPSVMQIATKISITRNAALKLPDMAQKVAETKV